MALIGYARVSTDDQCSDLQRNALEEAGCVHIFEDHGLSGAKRNRPALQEALDAVGPGDTLVAWRLDRLARSLSHLIQIVEDLKARGAHFESLTERLDTTSAAGEFVFHILGALAQMERRLISERTKAGMEAARRRGVKLGRPRRSPIDLDITEEVRNAPATPEPQGLAKRATRIDADRTAPLREVRFRKQKPAAPPAPSKRADAAASKR